MAALTITKARNVVEYSPILSILVLVTVLAFYHLGDKSMWLDEAASVAFSSKSWPELLNFWWNAEANMGLYYAALKLWSAAFGSSEVAIRSLSVLPAIGTVWVTWRVGLRLFGGQTALLAALILSLNAYFLRYAQEGRPYSLMTFLAGLATLSFIHAVERPRLWTWLLYTGIIAIGIYVHWFVALVPVAHVVSLLTIRRWDIPWRHMAISALIGIVLITPILIFLMRDIEYANWMTTRGLRGVASLFYSFAGRNPGLLAAYFLASCVAALGLLREYYQHRDIRRLWPFALLASLLFTPIVITLVIDYIRPVFVNRYILFGLPPLTLVVALGLTRLKPHSLSIGLLALILALSVFSVYNYYQEEKSDWRGVTQYLSTHAGSDDAVLFYAGYTRMGYDYYVKRFPAGPAPEIVFPVEGVHDPDDPPPEELVDRLSSQHGTTWLVLSHVQFSNLKMDVISQNIQATLAETYHEVEERQFSGVRVLRYRLGEVATQN